MFFESADLSQPARGRTVAPGKSLVFWIGRSELLPESWPQRPALGRSGLLRLTGNRGHWLELAAWATIGSHPGKVSLA